MAATASGKDKILRWTRIYVGGYDLSGDSRTFSSADIIYGEADVTGWSEAVTNFLRDGRLATGIRGYQALLNDATGRAYTILQAGNAQNVSLLFGGGGEPAIPDPAYLIPSVQMMDNATIDGNVAMINADFIPQAGAVDTAVANPFGVLLSPATSISSTTTGASHDNEGATTGGWHSIIHITATSSGNFAFTIEHSTDDSAWATLGTFTTTGGSVTSEYLSGSGTVNQYTRFLATRTAGTVTPVVSFARG